MVFESLSLSLSLSLSRSLARSRSCARARSLSHTHKHSRHSSSITSSSLNVRACMWHSCVVVCTVCYVCVCTCSLFTPADVCCRMLMHDDVCRRMAYACMQVHDKNEHTQPVHTLSLDAAMYRIEEVFAAAGASSPTDIQATNDCFTCLTSTKLLALLALLVLSTCCAPGGTHRSRSCACCIRHARKRVPQVAISTQGTATTKHAGHWLTADAATLILR
jgi:hypothetical protein